MEEKKVFGHEEVLDYFFERHGDKVLNFTISLKGQKKEIVSSISVESLEILFKLHGEDKTLYNILESLFHEFMSSYFLEKVKGENPVVPKIEEILDDLAKVKEEKGKDEDLSSTGLLRKELMKNFEESKDNSSLLNLDNLTWVNFDENDGSSD